MDKYMLFFIFGPAVLWIVHTVINIGKANDVALGNLLGVIFFTIWTVVHVLACIWFFCGMAHTVAGWEGLLKADREQKQGRRRGSYVNGPCWQRDHSV